jgi:hypothetical protein
MRAGFFKLCWLGGLLLAVMSCRSTPELKPPKQQEHYGLPPNEDRYRLPPDYPPNKFQQDPLKAKDDSEIKGPMGPTGMGPGVGRPGY